MAKKLRMQDEHWKGMPEFEQEGQKEFTKLTIRFDNEEDLKKFSEIIGQKLTPKTKSIWYPERSHWNTSVLEYIYDEDS